MDNLQMQNWDAFITIVLFLPALATFLWELAPSGVQRVWERNFFHRGKWNKKFLGLLALIVLLPNLMGWIIFVFTPALKISTWLYPLWSWGLIWLVTVNLLLTTLAFVFGRPNIVLVWIRWRLKVHWRKRKNFNEAFERYRGLLRVFGRESRGGEETSLVLRTMKNIATDILSIRPSKNGLPYTGNELEPLLEDVVTILLDSPHRPTPANFRHAARIFEAVFLYFRRHPYSASSQNDCTSPEKPSNQRDLQAATESIARLGQYIVDHLQDAAYDEELLRLLRLFQRCHCGEKHLSRALRDVTVAMLWSPTHTYRLNYTVALQSLTTLENFIRHISTKYVSPEKHITKDQVEGQSEIFYDYLSVLAAFTKAGENAGRRARQRWEQHQDEILRSYQHLRQQKDPSVRISEARLWADAIAHHHHTARFALADLLRNLQGLAHCP